MLNWRLMTEDEFNRIAEALIRRSVMEDNRGVDVKALDGRGGDGGIDLDARVERTGQLVSIYQLKFFPEGFSGEWAKARKPQIRKSFTRALGEEPPVWYLVVPRNLTPGERSYVRSLRAKRERPITRYLGATELDALLVRFPEIDSWAQREPLRTALEIANRPTAALSKPDDLGAELHNLSSGVGARSEYWDIDFSRSGDVITQRLIPKRPDAEEREPLSFTVTTDFAEHPELATAFQRSMEFGLTEPLVLPPAVVRELERHGPEWFAGRQGPGVLELHPNPTVLDEPSSIKVLGPADRVLAQRNAVSAQVTSGTRGGQLSLKLDDHISFTFMFNLRTPEEGQVEISSDVAGLSGTAAKRALRFLDIMSRAEKVVYTVGGHSNVAVIDTRDLAPDTFQVQLADDLAAIEDALQTTLRYPSSIDKLVDRIWARVVRHLLEGKVSLMPGVSGMNFVLSGDLDPGLEGLLESGGALRRGTDLWETKVFGQEVALSDVSMLMPSVTVEGAKEHLDALRAGRGEERKVNVVPRDGVAGILIWSPSLIGDMEVLEPTPWGLEGIKEHRQLRESPGNDASREH